jgi:hypothetical protein
LDYLGHTDNQARIVITGTSTGGLDNADLPTGYETAAEFYKEFLYLNLIYPITEFFIFSKSTR